jgi:hypothetical protein
MERPRSLAERALEEMVLGVSTRGYARSLEPLPEAVTVRGVSKSAVSEHFVYGTERKLAELMSRDLRQLHVVALLIDGVHFGEHVVRRPWGSMRRATSTCWDCARARPRTLRPYERCWPI